MLPERFTKKTIRLKDIKLDESNPNKMTNAEMDSLSSSMDEFGYVMQIIVDANTMQMVDGEHRLATLIKKGVEEAEVILFNFKDETERKLFRQVANKLRGKHDPELDAKEFLAILKANEEKKLFEMSNIRETEFYKCISEAAKKQNEDEVPELPDDYVPITQPGDKWIMGNHLLICGDSTKPETFKALMGEEKADLLLTDPPYGNLKIMNARQENAAKTRNYKEYEAHGNFNFKPVWDYLKNIECKKVIFGGNYFAELLPITTSWLVWDKRAGCHSFFSDCELAWTSLGNTAKICNIKWQGMIREGEHITRNHPTQKPIELFTKIMIEYASEAVTIVDLFGGSGSVLIACEKIKRKCRMVEKDIFYCDIIIKRWEEYTGKKARLIRDGKDITDETRRE